ncbi:MAG: hypothetical protein DRG82_05390 [Deltaproteobacteria bacterium]|nr:MAG: hypothetical protein DRG82_05390 [Deltaproteobacteria bacterium]
MCQEKWQSFRPPFASFGAKKKGGKKDFRDYIEGTNHLIFEQNYTYCSLLKCKTVINNNFKTRKQYIAQSQQGSQQTLHSSWKKRVQLCEISALLRLA